MKINNKEIEIEDLEYNQSVTKSLENVTFQEFKNRLKKNKIHFLWAYDSIKNKTYVSWGKCIVIFDDNSICEKVVNKKYPKSL